MNIVLLDIGADQMLKKYFNNVSPAGGNNLTLKLFANNITPADTDTAATYEEVTGGGYAPITLTSGSWTVNAANDPSDAVYAQQTFTFTGPITNTSGTVYGYYVVDADGVGIYSERLANPFQPANNGDQLVITPKFQLSKGTPS